MNSVNTVRELSTDERRAYEIANLVAFDRMPYFASALFSVIPVAAPGLGTCAVDRHWRLYMDPVLLIGDQAWPVQEMGTVLLHEMGHLLRVHAERSQVLPQPLSGLAWNYAADAEINDDLIDAGVVFPGEPVTPEALGCDPGGFAEDYYARLLAQDDTPAPETGAAAGRAGTAGIGEAGGGGANADGSGDGGHCDDDEAGCGSGAGCAPIPGELIAEDTTGGRVGLSGATSELIREQVAHAVHAAQSSGRGTVPAGVRRWATEVLRPPMVPWRRILRVPVRRAIAEAGGRTDYSLARPSRRSVGVVFPGLRGPKIRIAVVIDSSGSMSAADLGAALSEVHGVIRSAGVSRENVTIFTVDAAAAAPQQVSRVSDIAVIGGGGTDMRVGIAAAAALARPPHVVIVLTDGDTPWPDQPIPATLVCVIIGNDTAAQRTPAFAVTVSIPSHLAAT